MVMSFRVQELQQLMSMCSRSRVGRKQELLSRALYLVKNSADGPKVCKVAQAIRDLYNRRYPSRQITLNGSETAANQEVETSSKASTRSSTNSFNGEATPRVDYNEESLEDYLKRRVSNSISQGDRNSRNVGCPECGKFFRSPYEVKRHVDTVHLQLRPYPCRHEGCDKVGNLAFKEIGHRNKHERVHGGVLYTTQGYQYDDNETESPPKAKRRSGKKKGEDKSWRPGQ